MSANFIGGEWVGASSGAERQRLNPADLHEVVATAPDSSADDVDAAISAVADGYHEWAGRSAEARADVLNRAANLLEQRAERIAQDLVREEGKTLPEALNETRRTPANLRYYAGEATRLAGETVTAGDGVVLTLRQPVGVVAAITPWNFPLNIPSRKLGPALAAGNGVVLKPSELTPLTARHLVEALVDAGVPGGAIALVNGGPDVGAALVSDPRVAAVTFTGSTAVGRVIHRMTRPEQRTQLEMGGKNPVVVMDDANIDRAASLITSGAFGLTGQACTGTSRVIVHSTVHDQLVEALAGAAKKRTVGNGLHEGVDTGPLVSPGQLERVRHYLDIARKDGGEVVAGDEPLPADCEYGNFLRPSVITGLDSTSRPAREEIFGPVVVVLRVESFEQALAVANDTEYGLSAGIVTGDLAQALEFARRVESGVVKVNQPTTGVAINAPFGGIKSSSTQTFKEQAGQTMMRFYTVDKTIYLSP